MHEAQIREMLDHPDIDVQEQGVELCLSLGLDLIAGLQETLVEGWLPLGSSGRQRSWLRLFLQSDRASLRARPLRLSLAAMPDAQAFLPQIAEKLPGLEALDLSYTDVSDLRPLARLPRLQSLWLQHCPQLQMDTLEGLRALTRLDLNRTGPLPEALSLPGTLEALSLDQVVLPDVWTPPPRVRRLSWEGWSGSLWLEDHRVEYLRVGRLTSLASLPADLPASLVVSPTTPLSDPAHPWDTQATTLILQPAALPLVRHSPRLRSLWIAWTEPDQLLTHAHWRDHPTLARLDVARLPSATLQQLGAWPDALKMTARTHWLRETIPVYGPSEAQWAASEADHRQNGRRWQLQVPPEVRAQVAPQRIPHIKSMRALSGWGLWETKVLSDQILVGALVCRTVEEALREQGLLWAVGVPAYLAPWAPCAG